MNQTIFVIDDEISITDSVQFALEQEGFDVRVFHTGQEVMPALENGAPELLILDVGLTDGSGFDFFRQYRQQCQTPVIFLTARNDEIDRVVGLEMGADDYIGKPFSLRELVARVRVVLRRKESTLTRSLIKTCKLILMMQSVRFLYFVWILYAKKYTITISC